MTKTAKILIIGIFLMILSFAVIGTVLAQCSEQYCPTGEFKQECCPGGSLNPKKGLVPCGSPCCPCTLCHFFVLIENILEFVFFNITPPLALLMLIIGGGMFMLAAGDPAKITKARTIITTTLIGIVIIYGAFFLVGLLLQSVHLATWTNDIYKNWWEKGFFSIDCPLPGQSTPALPSAPVSTLPPATAFSPPITSGTGLTTIPINQTFSSGGNIISF